MFRSSGIGSLCRRVTIPQNTSRLAHRSTLSRAMSSTASKAQVYEWLVIIPDQEGALDKRMSVRPKHLAEVKPAFESGFLTVGGALLESQPQEGEPLKISGSAMIASGETREEVIEKLKKDVYSTAEVWDWSKVDIRPFKTALRTPM